MQFYIDDAYNAKEVSSPETCAEIHAIHTPDTLLKQASLSFAQGRHSEGAALLARARRQLAHESEQVVTTLDNILTCYAAYTQAQETLLNTCRSFIQAEKLWQTSLTQLTTLLRDVEPTQEATTCNSPPSFVDMLFTTALHHSIETHSDPIPTSNEILPPLTITCFGSFTVRRQQQVVTLCQNRNGQAIFRYLIAQPGYRATTDMLMDALWPDEEPETARRRLQVAISALRRSLNAGYTCDPGGGYILCKNRLYLLHPSVQLLTDMDAFIRHYETGRRLRGAEMAHHYELACQLYSGPFLPEDMYAHWSQRHREQLSQMYLSMCTVLAEQALQHNLYENTIQWSQKLLAENSCDESAYRLLMLAYSRLGRRDEALRQYQRCERVLREELGVGPMPETLQTFQAILLP